MAGESQAAAITRVVALLPQREMVLEALARVTGSAAFHSTRRGQAFLQYIVEHALAGELDQLKERCIGSTLFGRPADYDTGSDSIVRVTANEVRKRLTLFYSQAEAPEPVIFELPVGSYIPEIRLTEAECLAPEPAAEPEYSTPAAVAPPTFVALPAKSLPWRTMAISGWCLALILGGVWLRGKVATGETLQARSLRSLPWVALFEGGRTPQLILADSAMGTLRSLQPFPPSLEDYSNRRFLSPPDDLPALYLRPWNMIARKGFTSLADARMAAAYAPLAVAAGRLPVVRSARDFSLSDFRHGDNLILLGSNASNPWVELFRDQMDFLLRFEADHPNRVEIRHPHPGDPVDLASSVTSGATGEAFATLSLVNGLDGRGHVLIAQGTNMEGTDLAGELASNPDSMATALRRCGAGPANPALRFEILLRLNTTAGSATDSSILAVHCQSGK